MATKRHTRRPYSVTNINCTSVYYGTRRSPARNKKRHAYPKPVKKRHSEFHDALFSFGLDDRTDHLSDAEFNHQVLSEIGDLFSEVRHCAVEMVKCLFDIVKVLFGSK